jgi:hypothetical protein
MPIEDTGNSLAMVVEPTDFVRDSATPMTESDIDAAADEIAQGLGYSNMESMEQAHQAGPLSAIELNVHENSMLLASSGDRHPYPYQFNPFDVETENGLFFDPTNNGAFESFNLDTFLDFNDPIFGGAQI